MQIWAHRPRLRVCTPARAPIELCTCQGWGALGLFTLSDLHSEEAEEAQPTETQETRAANYLAQQETGVSQLNEAITKRLFLICACHHRLWVLILSYCLMVTKWLQLLHILCRGKRQASLSSVFLIMKQNISRPFLHLLLAQSKHSPPVSLTNLEPFCNPSPVGLPCLVIGSSL